MSNLGKNQSRQFRFWITKDDFELEEYLDKLPSVSSYLKNLVTSHMRGELVQPDSQEDLKKKKLRVDIRFKEVMIKLKEKELLYQQTFEKTPSFSAKKAMKIGVHNEIAETPSCFDEKNNRIMCPECGACFVFAVDQHDIPESKEVFIDHYIQKHSMKFPEQLQKELKSF